MCGRELADRSLGRTAPDRADPAAAGGPHRAPLHDYYRHGTFVTLFAALDVATGQVTAALKPKDRHQEFLAFLEQIERTYRGVVEEGTGTPVALHSAATSARVQSRIDRAWCA